ncbi:SDR family oxidoreductase [Zavarzinia sp. CC-PAN008]|uniref:SDR family oxidoreductase n=1 Tax=Zavarzinia sp. CC-PAN008 TaxID=3243332 RepID=UPI003F7480FB
MSGLLAGRVALVTGAANGIGRAIALAAAREGAALVLGDVDTAAGEDLAALLRAKGTQAHFRRTDVTVTADVQALAALAEADAVFANAGIEGAVAAPQDYDEATFKRVLDVNVAGVWRTMAAVLPAMLARRRGSIVATASVAGLVGAGGMAAYVASKHAVVGLAKSVAIDVAPQGVRVNAICPGVIETAMVSRLEQYAPDLRTALLGRKPMGRTGSPAEVAEAAIWLASDAASFVTGQAFAVDGGFVAQ